jgi:hypothetical protein
MRLGPEISSRHVPIPVAARSKAYLCARLLDGVANSESRRWHGCLSLVNVVLSGSLRDGASVCVCGCEWGLVQQ